MGRKKETHEQKQGIMEQILLHLSDCKEFGFSYKAKRMLFLDNNSPAWWKESNQKNIKDSIRDLNKLKFIKKKENYDGSVLVSLTEKGKLRILNSQFRKLGNKKEQWDGRWRMVAFDIPEECKKGRNALRYRLGVAGFYELQESLFLYPYDCEKELKDFIKLFKLENYVRFGLVEYIDNQELIKRFFRLD